MSELRDVGINSFEVLLDYLKHARGFDFTGYKRSSLMRRIDKRMQMIGVDGYARYVEFLDTYPEEFAALFNTILINVTSFFRDPAAWDFLMGEVVPHLVSRHNGEQPIRIWSAGCASGEEAYTLAMVMAEAMGIERAQEWVKIYATEVDLDALAMARQAVYRTREAESVPEPLREKYFERIGDRYVFHRELRRTLIFGRHDLIQDAPISRIDLLTCRNTLMYFNAEAQSRILARFHFALNDGGFLFLGKSETLLSHGNLFSPVDLRRRIFMKAERTSVRERMLLVGNGGAGGINNALLNSSRLRDSALDMAPVAQVVVDNQGNLVVANFQARSLFGLSLRDLGRPLQDLELSYRPVEIRSMIEKVRTEHRPAAMKEVEWPCGTGDLRCLDITVLPLIDASGAFLGTTVHFVDTTPYRQLQVELQYANQELEATLEELQSTNEELETTNEELQSTVEELETTNEEMQSTNEELETMNEELQSTNEELQTINDELRQRSDELNEVNGFLQSILASFRGAVVVLDREMKVMVWNQQAVDLWGLHREEVDGQHFLNLDIGLPVDNLRQPIRACLSGDVSEEEILLASTNRRGRSIECRITVTPLSRSGSVPEVAGAILLMEEAVGNP